MLHVALGKLPACGAQQVLACEGGLREDQRHRVLQLIAEAVGAARLVERAARPEAARERLVQQPAVQHEIERAVRRTDVDRAEHGAPVGAHGSAGRPSTSALRQRVIMRLGGLRAVGLAQEPDEFDGRIRGKRDEVCSAPQGSKPAPVRPESAAPVASAAGRSSVPLRPMNSIRLPVHAVCRSAKIRERDTRAVLQPQRLRASMRAV